MEQVTNLATLLLVDDDPIYAQFIMSSIAKSALPLNLVHFPDVEQALAYLRGEQPYSDRAACPMPALVMIDIILSSSTGFPVLDWLRENGHLDNEKVRVIMLTSSSRTEHIQEALRLGALSYLVKSPCPDNVIELLSKLLLQRSPIAPDRSNTQPPAQI